MRDLVDLEVAYRRTVHIHQVTYRGRDAMTGCLATSCYEIIHHWCLAFYPVINNAVTDYGAAAATEAMIEATTLNGIARQAFRAGNGSGSSPGQAVAKTKGPPGADLLAESRPCQNINRTPANIIN
ncbi:predicted protein [Coccidioides posadasii str. Silveira]|uniref:Predicted protein n=1 Tax=Coccidioides posadasii (strain RMSCC 757 / Silveira) TaxID=443226 RepID=E9CYT9_COCPS|nr:predicted protein [Coccidioides posadasii str. Silveira]